MLQRVLPLSECSSLLQTKLDSLCHWNSQSRLSFSVSKLCHLCLYNRTNSPISWSYYIDGVPIPFSISSKNVNVTSSIVSSPGHNIITPEAYRQLDLTSHTFSSSTAVHRKVKVINGEYPTMSKQSSSLMIHHWLLLQTCLTQLTSFNVFLKTLGHSFTFWMSKISWSQLSSSKVCLFPYLSLNLSTNTFHILFLSTLLLVDLFVLGMPLLRLISFSFLC